MDSPAPKRSRPSQRLRRKRREGHGDDDTDVESPTQQSPAVGASSATQFLFSRDSPETDDGSRPSDNEEADSAAPKSSERNKPSHRGRKKRRESLPHVAVDMEALEQAETLPLLYNAEPVAGPTASNSGGTTESKPRSRGEGETATTTEGDAGLSGDKLPPAPHMTWTMRGETLIITLLAGSCILACYNVVAPQGLAKALVRTGSSGDPVGPAPPSTAPTLSADQTQAIIAQVESAVKEELGRVASERAEEQEAKLRELESEVAAVKNKLSEIEQTESATEAERQTQLRQLVESEVAAVKNELSEIEQAESATEAVSQMKSRIDKLEKTVGLTDGLPKGQGRLLQRVNTLWNTSDLYELAIFVLLAKSFPGYSLQQVQELYKAVLQYAKTQVPSGSSPEDHIIKGCCVFSAPCVPATAVSAVKARSNCRSDDQSSPQLPFSGLILATVCSEMQFRTRHRHPRASATAVLKSDTTMWVMHPTSSMANRQRWVYHPSLKLANRQCWVYHPAGCATKVRNWRTASSSAHPTSTVEHREHWVYHPSPNLANRQSCVHHPTSKLANRQSCVHLLTSRLANRQSCVHLLTSRLANRQLWVYHPIPKLANRQFRSMPPTLHLANRQCWVYHPVRNWRVASVWLHRLTPKPANRR